MMVNCSSVLFVGDFSEEIIEDEVEQERSEEKMTY